MLSAILACDAAGGIGRHGSLPWPKKSEDLAYFKKTTANKTVIMGSETWQSPSMPKPLPKRTNVVVTHNPNKHLGAHYYAPFEHQSLIDSIKSFEDPRGIDEVFVIGGANLIQQLLPELDRFYLTRISGEYNCDTFLDLEQIKKLFHKTIIEKGTEASYEVWYRIK